MLPPPKILLLIALVVSMAVTRSGVEPPAPVPASAPASIFSAERAFAQLEVLLAEGTPHPVATAANARVRQRIAQRLRALGYAVALQRAPCCGGGGRELVNLYVLIPSRHGQWPSAQHKAIMLSAHYDSVAEGPGASDDGAGVAAILEVARAIRHRSGYQRPLILMFADGEEAGLLGSKAFVQRHPLASAVDVVINLEARGTSGPSLMFETSGPTMPLIATMQRAAARPLTSSLYALVYRWLPNDTDLSVYRAAGYRGYNFAFIRDVVNYHTPRDDLAHLDLGSLQHHGDNALELLDRLGVQKTVDSADAGEAVWFDVLGRRLVWWPSGWSVPLALMVIFVLLGAAIRTNHALSFPRGPWLRAFRSGIVGGTFSLIVLPIGLGVYVARGFEPSYGVMLSAASWAALIVAWRIERLQRHMYPLRCITYWLLQALFALFTALTVPSICYLWLVPSAAGALMILALPPETFSSRGWRATFSAVVPVFAAVIVWFPLVVGFRDALHQVSLPLLVLALVPVFSASAPLLTLRSRNPRVIWALLAGLGVAGLLF